MAGGPSESNAMNVVHGIDSIGTSSHQMWIGLNRITRRDVADSSLNITMDGIPEDMIRLLDRQLMSPGMLRSHHTGLQSYRVEVRENYIVLPPGSPLRR